MALHQHLGLPREPEEKILMDPHTMRWRSHGAPHAQAVPASQSLGDVSHTRAGGPSASPGPENDSVLYAPFWLQPRRLRFQRRSSRTKRPVCGLTRAIALQSSFSLLNQCILHHLAMRRMRVSAGDGGVAFCKARSRLIQPFLT